MWLAALLTCAGIVILAACALRTARKPPMSPLALAVSREIAIVAAHEAGHAIVSWYSSQVAAVTSLTISEPSGGVVNYRFKKSATAAAMWEAMSIVMAGLAAEALVYGRFSTRGSETDLLKARTLAEGLHAEYGAQAIALCPWPASDLAPSIVDAARMFSGPLDAVVAQALNVAFRRAKYRIREKRPQFDRVREAARKERHLDALRLEELLGPRLWA